MIRKSTYEQEQLQFLNDPKYNGVYVLYLRLVQYVQLGLFKSLDDHRS